MDVRLRICLTHPHLVDKVFKKSSKRGETELNIGFKDLELAMAKSQLKEVFNLNDQGLRSMQSCMVIRFGKNSRLFAYLMRFVMLNE